MFCSYAYNSACRPISKAFLIAGVEAKRLPVNDGKIQIKKQRQKFDIECFTHYIHKCLKDDKFDGCLASLSLDPLHD